MRHLASFICLILISTLSAADPTKGSDWPSFLGPNGNSTSTEKGILSPWPKDGLRLVWSHKAGEGYAIPSIQNGKLFFFDRHDNKARLTCMEPATGKEKWRFEYETKYEDQFRYSGGPRCCP